MMIPHKIPIMAQIEAILWDDLATIPVFTFPGLQAHSADVEGPAFHFAVPLQCVLFVSDTPCYAPAGRET